MNKSISSFGVQIKAADISKSREFYEGYLGLKPIFAYGSEAFRKTIPEGIATAPERYSGVTYDVNGANLEIADGHIAVPSQQVFSDPISSPKVSAMVRVASLVPFLSDKTYHTSFPVRKYYWGTVELVVKDPDGWVIVLISPFSDDEVSAIQAITEIEFIEPTQVS